MKKAHVLVKDIRQIAVDYNAKIRADDPRLRGMVVVKVRDECSVFVYQHAFVLKHADWFLVFSEHMGHNVFHEDEADAFFFANGGQRVPTFVPWPEGYNHRGESGRADMLAALGGRPMRKDGRRAK